MRTMNCLQIPEQLRMNYLTRNIVCCQMRQRFWLQQKRHRKMQEDMSWILLRLTASGLDRRRKQKENQEHLRRVSTMMFSHRWCLWQMEQL